MTEQIQYRDFFFTYWSGGRLAEFDSYTNPNARCPVCGDRVYFYQSPYGGRVFFDELGPPWPKHPCTNNSSPTYGRPGCTDFPKPDVTHRPENYYKPIWLQNGWDPVILVSLSQQENMTVIVVERLDNDDRITLGIGKKVMIDKQAPIFLQEHSKDLGIFDISFLEIHNFFAAPAQETGYRNARNLSDITAWKQAKIGSSEHQQEIALKLLFENDKADTSEIELADKNIDFPAADYWLHKSAQSGNSTAAKILLRLQKKKLSAKFGGSSRVSKTELVSQS